MTRHHDGVTIAASTLDFGVLVRQAYEVEASLHGELSAETSFLANLFLAIALIEAFPRVGPEILSALPHCGTPHRVFYFDCYRLEYILDDAHNSHPLLIGLQSASNTEQEDMLYKRFVENLQPIKEGHLISTQIVASPHGRPQRLP